MVAIKSLPFDFMQWEFSRECFAMSNPGILPFRCKTTAAPLFTFKQHLLISTSVSLRFLIFHAIQNISNNFPQILWYPFGARTNNSEKGGEMRWNRVTFNRQQFDCSLCFRLNLLPKYFPCLYWLQQIFIFLSEKGGNSICKRLKRKQSRQQKKSLL